MDVLVHKPDVSPIYFVMRSLQEQSIHIRLTVQFIIPVEWLILDEESDFAEHTRLLVVQSHAEIAASEIVDVINIGQAIMELS